MQLRKMIQRLREYNSGHPHFHAQNADIDNQVRPSTSTSEGIKKGQRHYLSGSEQHVTVINTFCKVFSEYLDQIAPEGSDLAMLPLVIPLAYCGFSATPIEWQNQHQSGRTNWLSTLVVAILRYLFSDTVGKPMFQMKFYALCYLVSKQECKPGEELFTRIGGGYHQTGRGFNIAPAGLSVASSDLNTTSPTKRPKSGRRARNFSSRPHRQLYYQITQNTYKVLSGRGKEPATLRVRAEQSETQLVSNKMS
jgi:hypothetical protein